MSLVSHKQIKAARSMLEWTQDDLAKESGVSEGTVIKLERGEKISDEGLEKILQKFEHERIEFVGTKGVIHHTQNSPRTFDGVNAPNEFYDCILASAEEKGGEILAIYPTTEMMARSLGIVNFKNLERLDRLRRYASIKCLLTDVKDSSLAMPSVQFRAIPQALFGFWPTFVCGDKSAIILTRDGEHFAYMVVDSLDTALLEAKKFSLCWDSGIPLGTKEASHKVRS
jgi:transcriptional regulator with XRE-family HTH domain